MKHRRTVLCLLLVLLLLLATGCGAKDEWEAAQKAAGMLSGVTEDPQLRSDTEKLLNAIIADDYAAAWDTIYQEIDAAEFKRMYVELQPHLAQIETYELVASNINKTVSNGVSTVSVRYMMTAGDLRLFVDVSRVEGYEGLTGFYLNEYVPVITTGTLGNMQGANVLQWIFLVVGLLELVFVLGAFVDCCRHKMKKKWLWLLLIALGYMIFSLIVTQEQFRVGMNVGAILNYTSLIRYSTGGFTLRLMIPVGAIVYLICRKTLFAKYALFQQQKAAAQQPVQPEPISQTEEIPEAGETEE